METKGDCYFRKEKPIKHVIGGTIWKITGTLIGTWSIGEKNEGSEHKVRSLSLKTKVKKLW